MRSRRIATLFLLLATSIALLGQSAGTIPYREGPLSRKSGNLGGWTPSKTTQSGAMPLHESSTDAVFVGGQNGTWFQPGQYPRLNQVSLDNDSFVQLDPVRSQGTIWGGGFNGSQLLVSGWGSDDDSPGPYVWLYNGAKVVTEGSLDEYGNALSWSGGDIFAASYGDHEWLLSGLGSGPLPTYSADVMNHMALGTFNGTAFTDLSKIVPEQQDGILYANAWNGQYWLVGGGFDDDGVLFAFDGSVTVDLTNSVRNVVPTFASVQSIAWNGNYWLIGGIGFLAEYDGHSFTDLTPQLDNQFPGQVFYSVNAIAWNDQSWMIGGGTPVAQTTPSRAWLFSYGSTGFENLVSKIPAYVANYSESSSILTIAAYDGMWYIGGYSGDSGLLLVYSDNLLIDYSSLISGFSYVDWISGSQSLTF